MTSLLLRFSRLSLLVGTVLIITLSGCRSGSGSSTMPDGSPAPQLAGEEQQNPDPDDPQTALRPDARDDFAATSVNTPKEIDVLANDCRTGTTCSQNDPRADLISFDTSSAQGGSIVRNDQGTDNPADDTLIYTPAADFFGNDRFSYTIGNDSELQDTATVFINVSKPEPEGSCSVDQSSKRELGQRYCIDTSFSSHDGTQIDVQLFVPDRDQLRFNAQQSGATLTESDPGFAPLLVHSHGFGSRKTGDFDNTSTEIDKQISRDAWHSGYWVISYTQRGFDESGGEIGLMSPAKEGLDFVRLLDWAVCHIREGFFDAAGSDQIASSMPIPDDLSSCNDAQGTGQSLLMNDNRRRLRAPDDALPKGEDDPSVGAIGYSYGGGFQFVAQSVDPRLDALLPMGNWFDLRYSLHANDTPKITWFSLLTAFALQGGNDKPVPELIIEGNLQANGFNLDHDDDPHNKARQVSVSNINQLAPNGAVAHCDNNFELIDPVTYDSALPENATTLRAPRAHLFMIQGHGDTLFNMNDGYNNARCFAEVDGLDVRFVSQNSGHPLPGPLGPPHYAGKDTGMYLDEIIHCGIGPDGQPQRYNTRELGLAWLDDKLRGVGSIDDVFPHKLCVTQANTAPNLILDTDDPFFNNGTTNDSVAAHQFTREGVVGDSVSDFLVGGTAFPLESTSLVTGPAINPDGTEIAEIGPFPSIDLSPLSPLLEETQVILERAEFAFLHEIDSSRTIAGIPLARLEITRENPLNDEIFYVGIAVERCHLSPLTATASDPCDNGGIELLNFQVTPIRVFPATRDSDPNDLPIDPVVQEFPADDPRNLLDNGHVYPIRWGADPGNPGNADQAVGQLTGVSARLHEGDKVGLLLLPAHPVYSSLTSPLPGIVNVQGEIHLPLQAPTQAPLADEGLRPPYIIERSADSGCDGTSLGPICIPL